jgi:hypothetical protein
VRAPALFSIAFWQPVTSSYNVGAVMFEHTVYTVILAGIVDCMCERLRYLA